MYASWGVWGGHNALPPQNFFDSLKLREIFGQIRPEFGPIFVFLVTIFLHNIISYFRRQVDGMLNELNVTKQVNYGIFRFLAPLDPPLPERLYWASVFIKIFGIGQEPLKYCGTPHELRRSHNYAYALYVNFENTCIKMASIAQY